MVNLLVQRLKNLWIYLLFLVVMILVLSEKKNLMLDEVLTYHLANNTGPGTLANLEEGKMFMPADSMFLSYITVPEDGRFNYANVWERQRSDVHPPLYYMLVHSVCSIFPNQYSEWYAGIVNIVFGLLILWCVRKIIEAMTHSKSAVLLCSLFYMTATGIFSAILFFRMYLMAMFFVSLITYIFLKAVDKGLTVGICISMILVSICGALTHYYFIIYLFFISLFFGIFLLIRRKFKQAALFILSMGIAGGASVLIFPGMVQHIFLDGSNGYRGRESFANLIEGTMDQYVWRSKILFKYYINIPLFGGMLIWLLVAVLFALAFLLVARSKRNDEQGALLIEIKKMLGNNRAFIKWILLILPSICYFLLVSKIAIALVDRYLYPIYAIVIVWVLCILYETGTHIVTNRTYQYIAMVMLLALGLVNTWKNYPWDNVGDVRLLKALEQYEDCNSIYVYDQRYRILASFYEVSMQKGVIFWHESNLSLLENAECKMDEEMIVYIINTCDQQAVLDKILELCPLLDSYEEIGSYAYATTYYLYGE